MRRIVPLAVVAVLLAACGPQDPSPSAGPPSSDGTVAPSASDAAALDVPAPGQPYTAEDILTAMAESRRPDGVPDELQTQEVAAAVADAVWTLGGEPWTIVAIGGSCGADACDLEVAGSPERGTGDDVYFFRVDPETSEVELLQSVLLGLERRHVEGLDRFARDRWDGDLEDFALATARWLPPPDAGRFVLAYRSGGEEGSPGVDLLVDLEAGTVEEMPAS